MASRTFQTRARPSATPLAAGAGITMLSFALLLSCVWSALSPVLHGAPIDDSLSIGLAVCGWVGLVAGVATLALGIHRLAQHADRAAGIRYLRTTASTAQWVTTQPDEAVEPRYAPPRRRAGRAGASDE